MYRKGDIVRSFEYELSNEPEVAFLYCFYGFGTHSETGERVAIYAPILSDTGKLEFTVTPAEEFKRKVDHEQYPGVKQQFAFEVVFRKASD